MRCATCGTVLGDDHYLVDVLDKQKNEYYVMHCCRSCAQKLSWTGYGDRFRVMAKHEKKHTRLELVPKRIRGEQGIEVLV